MPKSFDSASAPDAVQLTGYADPLSVAPGETVRIMVSTEAAEYEASIVRLIHGDRNPRGPGFKQEALTTPVDGRYRGVMQPLHTGSYAVCEDLPPTDDDFGFAAWIFPTKTNLSAAIVSRVDRAGAHGFGVALRDGCLRLQMTCGGEAQSVSAERPLAVRRWSFIYAGLDAGGMATLRYESADRPRTTEELTASLQGTSALRIGAPLFLAAAEDQGDGLPRQTFDGKIAAPQLFGRALEADELSELIATGSSSTVGRDALVAGWNLGAEPATERLVDGSGHGRHGRLVNRPATAVTDHRWAGALDWRFSSGQYEAAHFHSEDLVDAGWEPAFEWTVPEGTHSGVYAAWLRAGASEDHVPFIVRPPRARAGAEVGVLLPTFTYLAYANEHPPDDDMLESGIIGRQVVFDRHDKEVAAHPEYGISLYDVHGDDSVVSYVSSRRPIPNWRPDYRHWLTGAPRLFGADLYLTDWLEEKGFAHDTFTDLDLHLDGASLARRYRVLITGGHPEYWSEQMLDALQTYLDGGGRLMYLGGNGFYWVTSVDPSNPHVIEVRRGDQFAGGIKEPGQTHHSTTGEPGGLWRRRGRAPNELVGVGFSGQGWSERAAGYVRRREAQGPIADLVFAGVTGERFGDFGLAMDGAAGDEVDSADPRHGTPSHAIVLASSTGFDDHYQPALEHHGIMTPSLGASTNPDVRSDIIFMATPDDGAVFSVGSINWRASLSHDEYQNDISRITENVLRAFLTVDSWS